MIGFIKEKRKILISLFLVIGLFSSLVDVLILVQRPHDLRSKASGTSEELPPEFTSSFSSRTSEYEIVFDQRLWTHSKFGPREVFNLNKEYGFGRLDILEGESLKDLDNIKNEVISVSALTPIEIKPVQFKDKPSYIVSYKEKIIGEDTFYTQQIVKDGNKFFILEIRTPKLGDSQIYLDNLLSGFSFTKSALDVKGVSYDLTTVELVDLVRPSIANIIHAYCLDIKNLQPKISKLLNPQYSFCGSTKGSGFIINEKGIVATNGHVAKIFPEEAIVTNILYEGGKSFATDLIRGVYLASGKSPTQKEVEEFYNQINSNPQYVDSLLGGFLKLVEKKAVEINVTNDKYYVNVGNEPVRIDSNIPSSTTYMGKLLDFSYPNRYSYDALVNKKNDQGSDVALLEIENPAGNLFPALQLLEVDNLKEGAEVIIAGYPVLVEGSDSPSTTISYKTSTKPTVTRGIISAVKLDSSGRKVIQTDASIDHGNSGGPAFDSNAQVIGIATFMLESQTGNFNFLRIVSDLKELMLKNKVDNLQGVVSHSWKEGLNSFRNKRFGEAIKYFKEVEHLSPSHPTVKEFISNSEAVLANGESLEGLAGLIKGEGSNKMLVVFGGISVVSFMSAGFLGVLPLFTKNRSSSPESL